MKPSVRKAETKITKLHYTPIGKDAEFFRVEVWTDHDKDESALMGTMCIGFFLILVKNAIRQKAKIYEVQKVEFNKKKKIINPTITLFHKKFTYQFIKKKKK